MFASARRGQADGFDVFVDPDEAVLMAQRAEAGGGAGDP